MYKVKLKTRWMAPGINRRIGETVEVMDAIGKYLIDSGQAELIEIISEKPIERLSESAVISAPEKAVISKPAGRKPGKR
jgi:hypothetical protein